MRVAKAFLVAVVPMGIGAVGVTAPVKAGEPERETTPAYILKGQELFAAKKVERALEAFQKPTELEPDNLYEKVGQFATLANLGRPDDGATLYGTPE